MGITEKDLMKLLPGSKVIITGCEANEHDDNPGCLCALKGTVQKVKKQYETPFAGTPSWHLKGTNKRARLSEMTLIA